MKQLLYITIIWLLYACGQRGVKPEQPTIVGYWALLEQESASDHTIREADLTRPEFIQFTSDGRLIPMGFTFWGGWCNYADQYKLTDNTLLFGFTEPQCIPFLPNEPGPANILTLNPTNLEIRYASVIYRFKRAE